MKCRFNIMKDVDTRQNINAFTRHFCRTYYSAESATGEGLVLRRPPTPPLLHYQTQIFRGLLPFLHDIACRSIWGSEAKTPPACSSQYHYVRRDTVRRSTGSVRLMTRHGVNIYVSGNMVVFFRRQRERHYARLQ